MAGKGMILLFAATSPCLHRHQFRAPINILQHRLLPVCQRSFCGKPVNRLPTTTKHLELHTLGQGDNPEYDVSYNGTRPGYMIVGTLQFPDRIPVSSADNIPQDRVAREIKSDGAVSLPMSLHCCFPEQYPSMSAARKAVRRGEVLDGNGLVELNTSALIRGGETLQVQRRLQPGLFPQGKAPFSMDVLYEDDHIAVVVKPPGVGGVMICAKSRAGMVEVSRQFASREVSKVYNAIVCGKLEGSGSVDKPLGGQDAFSEYRAMRASSSVKYGCVTLVELQPHTGRKHQLRRHMHEIGFPIVGDKRYPPLTIPPEECGLMLWAVSVSFAHPVDGRALTFTSPIPPKFETFMSREQKRFNKFNN